MIRNRWSIGRLLLLFCLPAALPADAPDTGHVGEAALRTTDFEFISNGIPLSGIVSQPVHQEAKALIVFVHGYGNTDVRGWNMYSDLRSRFAAIGIASVTWDKPGQGRSGGRFDINQPVASSAQEVLDAVTSLRANQTPGAARIGLWGISRAGWIAPLALSQDRKITFWISVSGVTAEDNFSYFLRSNLPHEGSTDQEAEVLTQEWRRALERFRQGAPYDEYRAATINLRAHPFMARMTGAEMTRAAYEEEQAKQRTTEHVPSIDPATGMPLYVQDFDPMLARLDLEVLALFGEKDLNVDWRKTKRLYEATIGRNPNATLTLRTFPDGNHNLDFAKTGSLREMQSMTTKRKCDGYYAAQIEWLKQRVLR